MTGSSNGKKKKKKDVAAMDWSSLDSAGAQADEPAAEAAMSAASADVAPGAGEPSAA